MKLLKLLNKDGWATVGNTLVVDFCFGSVALMQFSFSLVPKKKKNPANAQIIPGFSYITGSFF